MRQPTHFWKGACAHVCALRRQDSRPEMRRLKTWPRFVMCPPVQKKSSTENRWKTSQTEIIPAIYGAGDSAGVSSVAAGESVVAAGASVEGGVVSVVTGAVVGAGVVTGATVSVFCSQAARSAAPARMQMYFFIIEDAQCFNRSIAASAVFGPAQNVT